MSDDKSVAELENQFLRGMKGSLDAIYGLSEKGALDRLDNMWRRMTEYVNFMNGVLEQKR